MMDLNTNDLFAGVFGEKEFLEGQKNELLDEQNNQEEKANEEKESTDFDKGTNEASEDPQKDKEIYNEILKDQDNNEQKENNNNEQLNLNQLSNSPPKKSDEEKVDNKDIYESKFESSYAENQNKISYRFKVIIIGSIAVGKTCILSRFIDNKFSKDYKCSIGVEFKLKSISINQSTCAELKIWDTCGDERYRAITRQYYKDSAGVILVYDITQESSFQSLDEWYDDIIDNAPKDTNIILVGNKCDLADERVISNSDGSKYAKKKGLDFIEVSAKTGMNITLLFEKLTNQLILIEKNKEKNIDGQKQKDDEAKKRHKLKNIDLNLDDEMDDQEGNSKKKKKKDGCC